MTSPSAIECTIRLRRSGRGARKRLQVDAAPPPRTSRVPHVAR
jgi:hypothetical protein